MNMKNLKLLCAALLMLASTSAFSQVSNDNEDGVNKMDTKASSLNYVKGQVVVKFSDSQTMQVKANGKHYAATNADALTQVLQKYEVEEMEQLLPNENP